MFSNSLYQPQVVAAISQFTSLLNSARTGTSAGTSTYRKVSSHRNEKKHRTEKQRNEAKKSNEKICIEISDVVALPTQFNIEELSPLISQTRKGFVPTHVSAETFFENKTGFKESILSISPVHEEVQLILNTGPFRKLFTSRNIYFHQRRGFKTVRSGIKEEQNQGILEKFIARFALHPGTGDSKKFMEIFDQHKSNPVFQEHLKTCFAEGYALNNDKSSKAKNLRKFVLKSVGYFVFGYFLLILIKLATKAFSGGGTGFSILNTGQLFEINPEEIHVGFSDVKGVDTAKDELIDVVDFLKDPEKFTALGAKLPKGVLLVGPPGVGKTLLARAVAGEAGVPFYQCSGSEFDEMYVGLGAKRVRDLFKQAKSKAPCVIFIDEIDSVAAKRTSSAIHPYANQTVNQLLAEMDGFAQNESIVVIGATNKVDNLDKALRRPGRFDVEVRVFLPDLKGRTDILKLYISKIKADSSVDAEAIAKGTIGFSGADLQNLVNQAALKAAMDGKEAVSMKDMDFARDKIIMGPENKNKIPDEKTNWITAIHEAGHTLVAYYTKEATPLHKVTISPRGMSLGHTSFIADKEQYNQTKAELMAQLDVSMGGRAAEEVVFGTEHVTTGAMSDFKGATGIATSMVKLFGMSDKIGHRFFQDSSSDVGIRFMVTNDMSPAVQEQIDAEIKRFLQDSYERAKHILRSHPEEHKRLAKALMEYETLDKDEIKAVIEGKKLKKEKV